MLPDVGYEEEVAGMGSSLAGVFEVFHRVLATRLREAATAAPAALPAIVAAVCDSCGRSEHTYLHAQQLLSELGRGQDGADGSRNPPGTSHQGP